MDANIEIVSLTKQYGDFVALNGINLNIRKGEVFGLLGPNGAGKTTTISILCGLDRPTSGMASVGGHDVVRETAKVKQLIGVCTQSSSVLSHLTGRENVELFGALHSLSRREAKKQAIEQLDRMGLGEDLDRRAGKYSEGMKRRLSLAMALVSDPPIVFLDEPTAAMDPQSRRAVWDVIKELKKEGRTCILTTHYIEEAESLCDRVGIIDHGRLIALDDPKSLIAQYGQKDLEDSVHTAHRSPHSGGVGMNLRRITALTGSNLKRTLREPSFLFMVLMFPIALTILFGTAFGAMGGGAATYKIGVVDMDHPSLDQHWSEEFTTNLAATNILSLQNYKDNVTAQNDLSEGKLQAVIVLPEGFGSGCSAYALYADDPLQWTPVQVQLYLDPASMVSTQAVPPIVHQVLAATIYGPSVQVDGPIALGTTQVTTSIHLTTFDHMAPGVITFAAVFLTMIIGQSFALDREKGLLRRMNTTPVTSGEFILSNVLSNMVIAVLQLSLVIALVLALGFHSTSSIEGLAFAFILVLVFSICSVGFGLITASVARSPSQATMIAFAFIMPQMFLGTFMGSSLSGAAQSVGALLPAYYVTDGLNTILLRGATLTSTALVLDLAIVAFFAAFSLIAGTALFRRFGNR